MSQMGQETTLWMGIVNGLLKVPRTYTLSFALEKWEPNKYILVDNIDIFFILAPSSNHHIVLNFTFMDTECTYDYLFVYDGDSYQSPLLATLSGNTLPQTVEAKSGKVTN